MTLVGIEKIDYKKKMDGTRVTGCKFYYTDSYESDKLEGLITGSFYISEAKAELIPELDLLELGSEFDILYDRFGGVKNIKLL